MATISVPNPRFDIVEYIKRLRNVGVSQEIAEVQAQEIERIIDSVLEQTKQTLEAKELATKYDLKESCKELELKIEKAKNQTLMLIGGFGIFFLGILAKGFHWL